MVVISVNLRSSEVEGHGGTKGYLVYSIERVKNV
jgi:hypothetical protein